MALLLAYRGIVHSWHCDHMGHMNVMWYTGKFDEATWTLVTAIGLTPAYLREEMRGMAAVDSRTLYKREVLAGDVIEIRSHVREVRNKAILMTHDMHDFATGDLCATCEITGVHIDRMTRKACPFGPDIRANAERFLPGASSLSDAA